MQFLTCVITVVALGALPSSRSHAQPAQVPDNQAGDRAGQNPPSAATGQPAQEKEAPPKPAPGEGIPALVADADQMQGVLGRQVRSSTGEDMGRIIDVVIDNKTARVRAAVIDFGGFLGVGSRQIAVAWNAIRVSDQGRPRTLVVDFTRDQLRVAPTYKAGEQMVVLGQPDAPAAAPSGPVAKDAPKEPLSK